MCEEASATGCTWSVHPVYPSHAPRTCPDPPALLLLDSAPPWCSGLADQGPSVGYTQLPQDSLDRRSSPANSYLRLLSQTWGSSHPARLRPDKHWHALEGQLCRCWNTLPFFQGHGRAACPCPQYDLDACVPVFADHTEQPSVAMCCASPSRGWNPVFTATRVLCSVVLSPPPVLFMVLGTLRDECCMLPAPAQIFGTRTPWCSAC